MTTWGCQFRRRTRRAVAAALAGALIAGACSSGSGRSAPPATTSRPSSTNSTPGTTGGTVAGTPSTSKPGGAGTSSGSYGVSGLRLSAGHSLASVAQATAVVQGAPLDETAVGRVEARLPAWTIDDALAQPFNWPTETKPPPRAGSTVHVPFPAPQQDPPAVVPSGTLHVLRVQPEGAVAIAPFVSITFDQPMVPIATVGQLDKAAVPATISPDFPGRWQWIGTQTLRFDAASSLVDRLPMATDFKVTIPAGTKSATGGVLADAATFSFSTPAVTVQSFQPDKNESLPLTPVFVAVFDQRINARAVLDTVVLRAADNPRPLRLATADEVAADDVARGAINSVPDGRWIAFRPVDPLPADTAITVEIGPGTPSAEGPTATKSAATYSGRTYAPLRITDVGCGFGPECQPPSDINITFNNQLDLTKFDPSTVTVDPAIAGSSIGANGNVISIHGATQGRTTYLVTIPAGLTDAFGQQLAAADTRKVTIGAAAPILQQFSQPLTTLDPLAPKPTISVVTVNHTDFHLRIFKVEPATWPGYVQYFEKVMQGSQPGQPTPPPPWKAVVDTKLAVANTADRAVETPVDLSAALGGPHGHVVVLVEPTEAYGANSNDYWSNRPTVTWVQATGIGLDAIADSQQLRAWATDLGDGAPMNGVAVKMVGAAGSATTDGDGVATIPLTDQGSSALLATSGDDTAILSASYFGESWRRTPITDEPRWYVFDDRQVYRPGEKVSIKGWIRRLTLSSDAQLRLLEAGASVAFSAHDAQGNVIAQGNAPVDPLGGFDLTFDIPAGANLGYSTVQFDLSGAPGFQNSSYVHAFQIEDFRRPEFEVAARHESAGPYVQGKAVTVAVDANYYAGGPLGAAPVAWQVTTAAATYDPPGWEGFDFGLWTPWWYADNRVGASSRVSGIVDQPCCGQPGVDPKVATFSGTTDANGSNYLQVDVAQADAALVGLPLTVTAQATVTDVNRQAWASSTSVLVHPADLYVGLRGNRTFVNRGDPLTIDAVVTDIDGKAVAGRKLRVTASRSEYTFKNGQWVESPADEQHCDVVSTAEAVTCTFVTSTGGTYTISSAVVDDAGRSSRTQLTRWVSGAESPPARNVEQQALTIVPDKPTYAPGDAAELLVQSPFSTGSGLLTVTRNGIISTTRFDVANGSAAVKVPVADKDIPNVDISIEVVGAAPRTADDGTVLASVPQRPAFATGQLTLPISNATRALTVTAVPKSKTVEPGAKTQVAVTVKDHSGAPVAGSQFAVVVVDEAVLALSNYKLQDPLATFYSQLPAYLSAQYGRQTIVLTDPLALASGRDGTTAASATTAAAATAGTAAPAAPGSPAADRSAAGGAVAESKTAGQSPGGTASTPIGVRTNFDALAVFEPAVVTDAAGQAVIDVTLPDNLTRYRVMVVAVAGAQQFGSAEANITARLSLMVRPSAPRFLNFGDNFELPVVVQNQTDAAMEADVVLQASNLNLTGGAGQHITVPANDRVEVRFPVSAAAAGTARFRVAAVSGDAADAATVELPVYTPATAEAFATYGVIDDGVVQQPVAEPTGVIPQFGGLDITTSSTSLQALTDAVLYLSQYRYSSSDALASRILAISSLRDVLDAFDAPGLPSPKALNDTVKTDIDSLIALQNDDGGFPYWERGKLSDPFNSVQATQALVVAKADGFSVAQSSLDRAAGFLSDIENHIPSWYSQDARDSVSAYALNVRMLAGNRDSAKAQALFAQRGKDLPLDAIAWLWPVIDDNTTSGAIERIIQNKAVDTAGAVTFTTAVRDDAYVTLQSDRRTDGLILDALIAQRPKSDLIPKVVAGLLAGQTQGRWDNVQENSFILLALKRYFDTYEKQTPDFVAQVWLGDRFAGEHLFAGRSTDRVQISIPTAELIAGGDAGLTINKGADGTQANTGRLYYRVGLRTAPADLRLQPLDRGFVVARTYEGVDNPSDVSRDADGTWHIKAGAKVRVRLTMVAESRRTHAALIDPLPAGLEILNPALATTPDIPVDTPQRPDGNGKGVAVPYLAFWYQTWFDHQNMRDDRAEAFSTLLPAGAYDYSYVARATTPGTFVVPPTRAEEMYAPETFGRGATDTVVVA